MPDYDTIRDLLPRVTPGPWATHYTHDNGIHLAAIVHNDGRILFHWTPGDATADDAEFIARARTVVDVLLAEVDRLRGLL